MSEDKMELIFDAFVELRKKMGIPEQQAIAEKYLVIWNFPML